MFILWTLIKNLLDTIHHYFARFKYRHQNCTRSLIIFHETCQEHNSTRAKLSVINFYRRVAVITCEVRTAYTDTEILYGGRSSKNTAKNLGRDSGILKITTWLPHKTQHPRFLTTVCTFEHIHWLVSCIETFFRRIFSQSWNSTILYNSKLHCLAHSSPQLVPILNQVLILHFLSYILILSHLLCNTSICSL